VIAKALARSIGVAAIATLIVHQPLVWAAQRVAGTPWRAFDLTAIPPLGVPAVLSAIFWGALWGPVIALAGRGSTPARHVRAGVAIGIATTIVGALRIVLGPNIAMPTTYAERLIVASIVINAIWAWSVSVALGRGARPQR
jgi:hypothetical protein